MRKSILAITKNSFKSGIIGIGISLMFFFSFSGFSKTDNPFLLFIIYVIFGYIVGFLISISSQSVIYIAANFSLPVISNVLGRSFITYLASSLVFYLCGLIFFPLIGVPFSFNLYISLGVGIGSVMISLFFYVLEQQQEKLELEKENKKLAIIEERNRIARELHDSVSQNLFGINLNLNTLEVLIDEGDHDRVRKTVEDLKKMVQEVQTEMRLMIYELKPVHLREKDFFEALESLVELYRNRYNLKITTHLNGNENRVESEVQLALYRVAQEALNNIVKHADADKVSITLGIGNNGITMAIKDNGKGFNVGRVKAGSGRFGISGMKDRVNDVGGDFDIESQPGQGTTVKVSIH
ncbi:sensor histidine kinase [Halothermothrix orenii]|uniref:histidine kinase n=1 Tax=Halothermothrix orenii (strain H 168 / OCM 544 / DSM 9562) TaxID=373903 RepID=B8CZJ7_HALOH|nr:sensor histidine kinase [Halothermothrix orenii]ACL70716.1 integral membrane sensor signal transduction histidine kinase [Halothermothrix orenii H 168]